MTKNGSETTEADFYRGTKMGEGFEHNPVLDVQRRQLEGLASRFGTVIRVLDLGCGAGTTTRQLVSDTARYQVVGADISPTALAAFAEATGRPGVRLSAPALPFRPDSFDLVISDDVVEHLVDTDQYAREIRRVLRPGGWLMLSTPNLAAWFNRIALLVGLQPAFTEVSFERVFGRPGEDIVGHLRVFTWRSISEFLEYHGFEIVEVEGARFEAMRGAAATVDGFARRFVSLAGNTVLVARNPPTVAPR